MSTFLRLAEHSHIQHRHFSSLPFLEPERVVQFYTPSRLSCSGYRERRRRDDSCNILSATLAGNLKRLDDRIHYRRYRRFNL